MLNLEANITACPFPDDFTEKPTFTKLNVKRAEKVGQLENGGVKEKPKKAGKVVFEGKKQ